MEILQILQILPDSPRFSSKFSNHNEGGQSKDCGATSLDSEIFILNYPKAVGSDTWHNK